MILVIWGRIKEVIWVPTRQAILVRSYELICLTAVFLLAFIWSYNNFNKVASKTSNKHHWQFVEGSNALAITTATEEKLRDALRDKPSKLSKPSEMAVIVAKSRSAYFGDATKNIATLIAKASNDYAWKRYQNKGKDAKTGEIEKTRIGEENLAKLSNGLTEYFQSMDALGTARRECASSGDRKSLNELKKFQTEILKESKKKINELAKDALPKEGDRKDLSEGLENLDNALKLDELHGVWLWRDSDEGFDKWLKGIRERAAQPITWKTINKNLDLKGIKNALKTIKNGPSYNILDVLLDEGEDFGTNFLHRHNLYKQTFITFTGTPNARINLKTPEQAAHYALTMLVLMMGSFFVASFAIGRFADKANQYLLPIVAALSCIGANALYLFKDPLNETPYMVEFCWGAFFFGAIALAAIVWCLNWHCRTLDARSKGVVSTWITKGVSRLSYWVTGQSDGDRFFVATDDGPRRHATNWREKIWEFYVAGGPKGRLMKVCYVAALVLIVCSAKWIIGDGSGKITWPWSIQVSIPVCLLVTLSWAMYWAEYDIKGEHSVKPMLGLALSALLVGVLFYLIKDLGPVLVLFFVFLTLFYIATKRWLPSLIALVASLLLIYLFPANWIPFEHVSQRINMLWHPFDAPNDQIARSIWGFATGGVSGSGADIASPTDITAGHTDLILAVVGEAFGCLFVLLVIFLFAGLVYALLKSASKIDGFHKYLLVGAAAYFGGQTLVIVSGSLGLFPLTGVPIFFVSYGNTATLIGFCLLAFCLFATHVRGEESTDDDRSKVAVWWARVPYILALGVVVCGVLYKMVFRRDFYAAETAIVYYEETGKREFQNNPRLYPTFLSLKKATIVDANGLPLAFSEPKDAFGDPNGTDVKRRDQYAALGRTIFDTNAEEFPKMFPMMYTPKRDGWRLPTYSPLGQAFYDQLLSQFDFRPSDDWSKTKEALFEDFFGFTIRRSLEAVGQGKWRNPKEKYPNSINFYKNNYADLVPKLRERANYPKGKYATLRNANRIVTITLDTRVQMFAQEALEEAMDDVKNFEGKFKVKDNRRRTSGAACVIDAKNGHILASVSLPRKSVDAEALAERSNMAKLVRHGCLVRTAIEEIKATSPEQANKDNGKKRALTNEEIFKTIKGTKAMQAGLQKALIGEKDLREIIAEASKLIGGKEGKDLAKGPHQGKTLLDFGDDGFFGPKNFAEALCNTKESWGGAQKTGQEKLLRDAVAASIKAWLKMDKLAVHGFVLWAATREIKARGIETNNKEKLASKRDLMLNAIRNTKVVQAAMESAIMTDGDLQNAFESAAAKLIKGGREDSSNEAIFKAILRSGDEISLGPKNFADALCNKTDKGDRLWKKQWDDVSPKQKDQLRGALAKSIVDRLEAAKGWNFAGDGGQVGALGGQTFGKFVFGGDPKLEDFVSVEALEGLKETINMDEKKNRVSNGTFAPGSIFKLVTATAALENGEGSFMPEACLGENKVWGVRVSDNEKTGSHTGMTLKLEDAIVVSCNIYFAKLFEHLSGGKILDLDKVKKGKDMLLKAAIQLLGLSDLSDNNALVKSINEMSPARLDAQLKKAKHRMSMAQKGENALTDSNQSQVNAAKTLNGRINLSDKNSLVASIKAMNPDYLEKAKTLLDLNDSALVTSIKKMVPDSLVAASYGQELTVRPLDMASLAATIANEGKRVKPTLLFTNASESAQGGESVISKETANKLARAMERVASDTKNDKLHRTAEGLKLWEIPGMTIGAKTGTAEVKGEIPHSWFIGFAKVQANQKKKADRKKNSAPDASTIISFAFLVENGGYGSRAAGNAAKRFLEKYEKYLNDQMSASFQSAPAKKKKE